MQVTSKWIDGMCFVGTAEGGHSVVMEGSAAEGAVKRGPSPMEMLLLGVAGCSSIDVVMIAEKQRQKVTDCRATVTAKRADDAPRVFTEIHIHFKVFGHDLKESAIERAVQMSAENTVRLRLCWAKRQRLPTVLKLPGQINRHRAALWGNG